MCVRVPPPATGRRRAAERARPLARILQEHVKKPLAEELLFGKLVKGGLVRVDMVDDALVFDIGQEPKPGRRPPTRGDGSDGGGAAKVPELVQ